MYFVIWWFNLQNCLATLRVIKIFQGLMVPSAVYLGSSVAPLTSVHMLALAFVGARSDPLYFPHGFTWKNPRTRCSASVIWHSSSDSSGCADLHELINQPEVVNPEYNALISNFFWYGRQELSTVKNKRHEIIK